MELIDNQKFYKKKFISQGLVNYADDNDGIILIKNETISNALDSIKGVDVFITHEGKEPVGKVVDAYYEPNKAEFIAGFIIWNDEAKDLLDNKDYSVSCVYEINEEAKGGVYHNINYEKEAIAITFKNIAIVDNPRFQEARDYVNDIKEEKEEIKQENDKINNIIFLDRIREMAKQSKYNNVYENGGAGSGRKGHRTERDKPLIVKKYSKFDENNLKKKLKDFYKKKLQGTKISNTHNKDLKDIFFGRTGFDETAFKGSPEFISYLRRIIKTTKNIKKEPLKHLRKDGTTNFYKIARKIKFKDTKKK